MGGTFQETRFVFVSPSSDILNFFPFKVIEAGGWDYDRLVEWEAAECKDASRRLQNWLHSKTPQDWDSTQRTWLYIQLKDTFAQPLGKDETFIKYTHLFWPEDWSQANPYNCFWLRFPDSSPLMPWRCYASMKMVDEWYKVGASAREVKLSVHMVTI
jgi:hypothetical protein